MASTPKPTVEPAMGEVQIVSTDQLVLQDLFGSDVVDDLHFYETPPGKVFTISFLVSMLQWLTQCGDELDDGLVVYPICFEEIAICLAHQPQFCFPFWNAHTGSMDRMPIPGVWTMHPSAPGFRNLPCPGFSVSLELLLLSCVFVLVSLVMCFSLVTIRFRLAFTVRATDFMSE